MKKHLILSLLLLTFSISIPLTAQPYSKSEVNPFDQLWMNPYSPQLDKAGDIIVCATMAAPLVLLATPSDQWLTEFIMYGEACLFSYGLKVVGKAYVDRARPYMYFDNYPLDQVADGDYMCSWPSAHSAMAFTSAAFTSYVFCKYFPESSWRYAVVGGAYAAAVGVASLRIASGNHFLTDVLTGAAIGTLSGFLIPYLHTLCAEKLPQNDNVQVEASPFGLFINIKL